MDIKTLQKITEEHSESFLLFNDYASLHYKVYKIPKKNIGFRTIAQPTKALKKIQRDIIKHIKPQVCVHECAMAYVENRSIKDNALAHKNSNFLLKVDIENFFNSLTPAMFLKALKTQGVLIDDNVWIKLKQFLFWNINKKKPNGKLVLSIGAPSSPFISNVIMYEFDVAMKELCESKGITYTRYADDLTFSTKTKNILFNHLKDVRHLLKKKFNGKLLLNESKTVFSSKKHNRHITGITLTNNNKISIGREKKRYIAALVHKYKNNELDTDDIIHLQGLLSFAFFIERKFAYKLSKKYGNSVILSINKYSGESDGKKT